MLSKCVSRSRQGIAAQSAAIRLSSFSNGVGWGVSIPQLSGPGGVFVTKYRITRPYNDDTTWDDFLIALPEKDCLAKTTKEVPLFIRFLKLVTDKEDRREEFSEFVKKHRNGLTVESDVFLSTDELLAVMWKNGYSDQERNALQFTFPSDYRFHYPEISVLFGVEESDAYKFCMRTRMEKSHIGELDHEATKRRGFLRDHWLVYMTGWYIFKNYPFFHYMFFVKTWGFSMWFVSVWMLFGRLAHKLWKRNDYMLQQKTAAGVMEGEDKIVESMKRFSKDTKCVEYLSHYKKETQETLSTYRKAMVEKQKQDITQRVNTQLAAIQRFEAGMGANLQEVLVKETANSFREKFSKDDPKLYQASVDAAIGFLGNQTNVRDPVVDHFASAFEDVAKIKDFLTAPAKAKGTVVERVAFQQQEGEHDFARTFMVSKEEAQEVKAIGAKAKSAADGLLDFSSVDTASLGRLEELYKVVNTKVGFLFPSEQAVTTDFPTSSGDSQADQYSSSISAKLDAAKMRLRNERLTAFVHGF